MHIFDELKRYQKPRAQQLPDIEPPTKNEISFSDRITDWFGKYCIIIILALAIAITGTIWITTSVSLFGMMFWGLVSLCLFALIGTIGARIKRVNLGCAVMILALVCAVSLFVGSEKYWDFEQLAINESKSAVTVFHTPHGECYHKYDDCYHIEGHKVSTTNLYRAEKKGLRPCEDCYR